MGLFDYVKASFVCPYCKNEEKEHNWQTKSLKCIFKTYRVGDTLTFEDFEGMLIKEGCFEIHTVCKKCEKFVSATIEVRDYRITEKIDMRKD